MTKIRVYTEKSFLRAPEENDCFDEYLATHWIVHGSVLLIIHEEEWHGQRRETTVASYNSNAWQKVIFAPVEEETSNA